MSAPIAYRWSGEGFEPLPGFAKLADKEFVVGEVYRLEIVQQRSAASHAHYFAALNEAWQNIPEAHAGRWPTVDHLRRWALVQAGYRNETTYIAHSKAEALRFSSFLHSINEYAVIQVSDKLVTVWTAKSQSFKAMNKKEFGESKNAVLDVIAKLIGVSTDELSSNSGRAA